MSRVDRLIRRVQEPPGWWIVGGAIVATDLLAGLAYLLSARSRFSSPAFNTAKSIMTIHSWGWVFLVFAGILGVSMATRRWLRVALYLKASLDLFWAYTFLHAALRSVLVSFTSAILWAFVAVSAIGLSATVTFNRDNR